MVKYGVILKGCRELHGVMTFHAAEPATIGLIIMLYARRGVAKNDHKVLSKGGVKNNTKIVILTKNTDLKYNE